jgi:hypothetical protein
VKFYTESNPVNRYFLTFACVHAAARLMYEAKSAAVEQRVISRNEVAKRARDLADPAAERLFRQCLPRSSHVDKAVLSAARDWSFGSSVHAHKRPSKSKPLTVEALAWDHPSFFREPSRPPTNPRLGGTKFGRQSFSSGAPYRRTGAWDLRVNNPVNALGGFNPPRPERGKCSRFADDWRPNRCRPYPAWASAQP